MRAEKSPMASPAKDPVELGRVEWYAFLRLFITISSIGIILIYKAGGLEEFGELRGAYVVLVCSCALNFVYLLLLRMSSPPKFLPLLIVAADLIVTAILTYLTGAASSLFVLFYFAPIVVSSLIREPWSSIRAAIAATGLSLGVTLVYLGGERWGWRLPYLSEVWLRRIMSMEGRYLVATVSAQSIAYVVVGMLSGMLGASLRQVRLFSEEILENMGEGAIALDNENRVAFLNSRARELLGLSLYRRVKGMRCEKLLSGEMYGSLLRILKNRAEGYVEMEFVAPSGKRVPLVVTSSVLRDDSGRPRGLVVILIDITLRKRAEEAERRAARQEAAGELAAGIAHEIRNPLASIRGAAQELLGSASLAGNDGRLMELVVRESDRLNGIITDFLAFARAKPPNRRPCNLSEVVRSSAFVLQRRAEAGEHPVRLKVEDNLLCLADEEQIGQVLLNLGVNALEACDDDDSPVEVRAFREFGVSARDGDRPGIKVEFVDRGSGVPPGRMAKVFDPFFTTKPGGTGLGLSIVQRIVQNHDGDVEITSNPDGGTIVSIWLPEYRVREGERR